ncbi:MAG: signal peptidase II [Acidimicrobiales bacterium]
MPVDEGAGGSSARSNLAIGAVAVTVVVVDQLAKLWALRTLADGPVHVVGPLRLSLVRNTGAAFGLGDRLGTGIGALVVPLLAIAALVAVAAMAMKGGPSARAGFGAALALLLGGAAGNLVDRLIRSPGLLRGAVVDFIDLGFWPVFNVADMAVTVGCALLLLQSSRSPRR